MFFELLFASVFLNRNVSVDLTCRVTYKALVYHFHNLQTQHDLQNGEAGDLKFEITSHESRLTS